VGTRPQGINGVATVRSQDLSSGPGRMISSRPDVFRDGFRLSSPCAEQTRVILRYGTECRHRLQNVRYCLFRIRTTKTSEQKNQRIDFAYPFSASLVNGPHKCPIELKGTLDSLLPGLGTFESF
jgi:hypothetical protein